MAQAITLFPPKPTAEQLAAARDEQLVAWREIQHAMVTLAAAEYPMGERVDRLDELRAALCEWITASRILEARS
jgi:hypothetical protein